MALQINKTTEHGIVLPAAYVRITSYKGDINNITVSTETYADAAARADVNAMTIDSQYFNVTPPTGSVAPDMVAWGYAQLKLLPEFSTATDV